MLCGYYKREVQARPGTTVRNPMVEGKLWWDGLKFKVSLSYRGSKASPGNLLKPCLKMESYKKSVDIAMVEHKGSLGSTQCTEKIE